MKVWVVEVGERYEWENTLGVYSTEEKGRKAVSEVQWPGRPAGEVELIENPTGSWHARKLGLFAYLNEYEVQ